MPLKDRQLKRLGRIEERNPNRAEYVAKNMLKRENRQSERADKKAEKAAYKASRVERGANVVENTRDKYSIPMSSRDQRIMEQNNAIIRKGRDYPLSPTPEPKKVKNSHLWFMNDDDE